MQEKYLLLENNRLAYYEQNPQAPYSVFCIHGNSASSRNWRKQIVSTLFSKYRLITIDLPAHGKSDASQNPVADYSLPGLGRVMATAIRELSLNRPFVLCGVSLGTNIIAEMLTHLLPAGIIFAGPCILGPEFTISVIIKETADTTPVFQDENSEQAIKDYALSTSFSRDQNDITIFMEDHATVKSPFRSFLLKSILDGNYSDQILKVKKANVPVCVICGRDEQIVHTDYLERTGINLWRHQVFKIPDASHLVNIDQPEAFNELASTYLGEIFK